MTQSIEGSLARRDLRTSPAPEAAEPEAAESDTVPAIDIKSVREERHIPSWVPDEDVSIVVQQEKEEAAHGFRPSDPAPPHAALSMAFFH